MGRGWVFYSLAPSSVYIFRVPDGECVGKEGIDSVLEVLFPPRCLPPPSLRAHSDDELGRDGL